MQTSRLNMNDSDLECFPQMECQDQLPIGRPTQIVRERLQVAQFDLNVTLAQPYGAGRQLASCSPSEMLSRKRPFR